VSTSQSTSQVYDKLSQSESVALAVRAKVSPSVIVVLQEIEFIVGT